MCVRPNPEAAIHRYKIDFAEHVLVITDSTLIKYIV